MRIFPLSDWWWTALVGCLAVQISATDSRQQQPPKALALLVGIDKYEQPANGRVAELKGTSNDVDKVKKLLIRRFGFAPADIVTLKGARATHEAIVRAFHDHLIARAGDDTQVVFWFSGHGSRVPDPSGHDTSVRDADDQPKDDTLLAYDSRAGNHDGSRDITDDELHSLLAAVQARQILVVTDCCHSGGVMRGGALAGVRATGDGRRPLDQEERQKFWPTGVAFHDDDTGELVRNYVHLAACGSDQLAGEISCFGRSFGTLTWFLTDVLSKVDAKTSWRTVGELVRARIAGVGTHQSQVVRWSGDALDSAILGGDGARVLQGFAVHAQQGSLRVEAGRIHGLGDGSQLRAFGLDEKIYGTMRVVSAHSTWSKVEWVKQARRVAAETPLRVRPHGELLGHSPLRIRLDTDVGAELLSGCAWAEPTEHDPEYVLAKDGDALVLCEPGGAHVRRVPAEASAAHDVLFQEYCFRCLWEGVAQPGSCPVAVRVSEASHATAAEFALPKAVFTSMPGQPRAMVVAPTLEDGRPSGAVLELNVVNRGSAGVHVAVLSVAEDRKVNMIWGEDVNNYLDPQEKTTLLVAVGPSASWQRDRPMIDRYVVIATTKWADFRAFTSNSPELTRGGVNDGLPAFLQRALNREPMRGGGNLAWGVTWFDLALVPPKDTQEHAEAQEARKENAKR